MTPVKRGTKMNTSMTSLGRCHWFWGLHWVLQSQGRWFTSDSLTRNLACLLRLVIGWSPLGWFPIALVLLQQPQLVPAFGPMDRCWMPQPFAWPLPSSSSAWSSARHPPFTIWQVADVRHVHQSCWPSQARKLVENKWLNWMIVEERAPGGKENSSMLKVTGLESFWDRLLQLDFPVLLQTY